jgi:hypothetical protein
MNASSELLMIYLKQQTLEYLLWHSNIQGESTCGKNIGKVDYGNSQSPSTSGVRDTSGKGLHGLQIAVNFRIGFWNRI